MRNLILLVVLTASALVSSGANAGDNRKSERIETPINASRLARMISVAKSQCFDMGYPDIIEDKEQKTLVCKQDNSAIFLRFDSDGYFIKIDAFFNKMPVIGGIFSQPKKHRKRMIKALEKV